jgi:hypothetical protein
VADVVDPAEQHAKLQEEVKARIREKAFALSAQVAPEVWKRMAGNGSLKIDIDTDVQCYGPWEPHANEPADEQVARAQDWVEYIVHSTIRRLVDQGEL